MASGETRCTCGHKESDHWFGIGTDACAISEGTEQCLCQRFQPSIPTETRPEIPELRNREEMFGKEAGGYIYRLECSLARSETREAVLEKALRDAKREGWNDAIDAVCHVVPNSFPTGVIRALSKRSPDGTHD